MTNEVFTISVIASVLATVMVFIVQRIWNGMLSKKNFKEYEGEYKCFSYVSQDPRSSDYNKHVENNATVTITYKSLNKLEITNQCNDQTWKGVIYMKNKNVGDLTWKYMEAPLRIGSKELSFWENGTEKIVYLNERFDGKYGRELLKKKGDSNAK